MALERIREETCNLTQFVESDHKIR